jgi:hypothetical protein
LTKNTIIRARTLDDIDNRVDRVLRDLGNPEPPLKLEHVLELLKLDRAYYTGDDPSLLETLASRIRVGTLQVFRRPTLLLDVVRTLDLRGLYLLDQKRILIDENQPKPKHRWLEAHEIGHSLLPWHEDAMFGDSEHTLLPNCHDSIEAEANYAGGRLLFLADRFSSEARDYSPSLDAVRELKPKFGNTYTTTFWRCVEAWGQATPTVGLITQHPHPAKRSTSFDPEKPCRHFIQSGSFAAQYSKITEKEIFAIVTDYVKPARGGALGETTCSLANDNGEQKLFHFETFHFHFDVLTLGYQIRG